MCFLSKEVADHVYWVSLTNLLIKINLKLLYILRTLNPKWILGGQFSRTGSGTPLWGAPLLSRIFLVARRCNVDDAQHYGIPMLFRVSVALGKGPNTLGKAFDKCHTWQRPHGKILAGKAVFAECYFSSTRQRLCWVSILGKDKNEKKSKKSATMTAYSTMGYPCFAECLWH